MMNYVCLFKLPLKKQPTLEEKEILPRLLSARLQPPFIFQSTSLHREPVTLTSGRESAVTEGISSWKVAVSDSFVRGFPMFFQLLLVGEVFKKA